ELLMELNKIYTCWEHTLPIPDKAVFWNLETYEEKLQFYVCVCVCVCVGPGCKGVWDRISCWDGAEVGQIVTIPCPNNNYIVVFSLSLPAGNISKNCTADGWSEVYPNITSVCGTETQQDKLVFYTVVKTLYTLGHSLSLIALTTGSAILCIFRRLHCTPSLVGCRATLVFFHYFILANVFWLLVEGLYLHTLLLATFAEKTHLLYYMIIGWGTSSFTVHCWERNDHPVPIWVINGPIVFSIMVNFILFISIIRILLQKLRCPDVGGNDHSQYRRLAKSTLLLIPLFGIHYVVFVSLNESLADYKIFFDLALGSFQVRCELRRKWQSLCLNCPTVWNSTSQNACVLHKQTGTESQGPSRVASALQTEATLL
uniref:Vasoactive intestinal peptide receptor 2 n=1 Tax=Astyanax mexicanus TaxID=7994 RepID=A0A3B1IHD8_ASTMX